MPNFLFLFEMEEVYKKFCIITLELFHDLGEDKGSSRTPYVARLMYGRYNYVKEEF